MFKRQPKPVLLARAVVGSVFVAVVITLLSGCAVHSADEPLNDDPVQALVRKSASKHAALYGNWVLMKLKSASPEKDDIPQGSEPYMEITLASEAENAQERRAESSDGQAKGIDNASVSLAGVFACNRYFGNAELQTTTGGNSTGAPNSMQGEWSVATLALTRKACRPPLNVFEHHSVLLLQNSTHYALLDDNTLMLTDGSGNTLQFKKVESKLLYIEPKLVDCMGFAPQKCMRVRESKAADAPTSLLYNGIQGFDYQEGFDYVAAVNVVPVARPPADASSIRYELQELVEKTPAQ